MKIVSDGKVLEVSGGVSQDIYSTEERVVDRWEAAVQKVLSDDHSE